MVMARVLWPSSAAIASRLMPRLIAWVARVWRSWWAVTWPIPAEDATLASARSTRPAVIGRPRCTGAAGCGGEVGLVGLQVDAVQLGEPDDIGMVGGQPAAEETQVPLDRGDGRRAQAQRHLGDVALRRLLVGGSDAGPAALADGNVAGSGDGVDGLVVEQGGLQPVQHRS